MYLAEVLLSYFLSTSAVPLSIGVGAFLIWKAYRIIRARFYPKDTRLVEKPFPGRRVKVPAKRIPRDLEVSE